MHLFFPPIFFFFNLKSTMQTVIEGETINKLTAAYAAYAFQL